MSFLKDLKEDIAQSVSELTETFDEEDVSVEEFGELPNVEEAAEPETAAEAVEETAPAAEDDGIEEPAMMFTKPAEGSYDAGDVPDVVPDYEFKYFIEGDTLIAGQNCKKFYSFNEHYNNQTEYKMALHESEGKVYFIPSGSTESYILYDFTIPVGTSTVISSVSIFSI